MEFSINSAECIKEYQKLGETVYQNICTGQEAVVPWGVDVWFGVILIIFVITVLFVMLIKLIGEF